MLDHHGCFSIWQTWHWKETLHIWSFKFDSSLALAQKDVKMDGVRLQHACEFVFSIFPSQLSKRQDVDTVLPPLSYRQIAMRSEIKPTGLHTGLCWGEDVVTTSPCWNKIVLFHTISEWRMCLCLQHTLWERMLNCFQSLVVWDNEYLSDFSMHRPMSSQCGLAWCVVLRMCAQHCLCSSSLIQT